MIVYFQLLLFSSRSLGVQKVILRLYLSAILAWGILCAKGGTIDQNDKTALLQIICLLIFSLCYNRFIYSLCKITKNK